MSYEVNGMGIHLHNLNSFRSTDRTGTGSAEVIPHNLAVVPTLVLLQPRDSSSAYTIDATDNKTITVTVANGAAYDLLALL